MELIDPPFSGSYPAADVTFLLRQLELTQTPLMERERRIQAGKTHYSEMIGSEDAPTLQRIALFKEAMHNNAARLVQDVCILAAGLVQSAVDGKLTLVSIARAGTPIGVLLLHRIRQCYPTLDVVHFSISVIRDRGVDAVAIHHILKNRPASTLRFIDGWTGKGTIAQELHTSISRDSSLPPAVCSGLWVPLDVCGAAVWAASHQDYVIPPSLLGGTISGLLSRSVLRRADIGSEEMHGCVKLMGLKKYDLTNWFIHHMVQRLNQQPQPTKATNASQGPGRWDATQAFLTQVQAEMEVEDRNRIKLGIGETVRVLLRRLPRQIWLSEAASQTDAEIVKRLAKHRRVPLQYRQGIPFAAVAIIADAGAA